MVEQLDLATDISPDGVLEKLFVALDAPSQGEKCDKIDGFVTVSGIAGTTAGSRWRPT